MDVAQLLDMEEIRQLTYGYAWGIDSVPDVDVITAGISEGIADLIAAVAGDPALCH